jgi:hypothetical protein
MPAIGNTGLCSSRLRFIGDLHIISRDFVSGAKMPETDEKRDIYNTKRVFELELKLLNDNPDILPDNRQVILDAVEAYEG